MSVCCWRDAPAADFAVIGDPVAHSLSPKMQSAALAVLGKSMRYLAVHVPQGEVVPALDRLSSLGYRGVNVTVPHKQAVIEWLDSVDEFAVRAQSVNTIRIPDRMGINTDADGFLDTLAELGISPPGRVLILGAGGSARALALALSRHGFELAVYNRTRSRAEVMIDQLGIVAELLPVPDPHDSMLILNTTSASLSGEKLALDWSSAPRGAVAYDLMYGPAAEPFLAGARGHGLRAVDGLGLLVAQGARSLEWWLGEPAPRAAMREALT